MSSAQNRRDPDGFRVARAPRELPVRGALTENFPRLQRHVTIVDALRRRPEFHWWHRAGASRWRFIYGVLPELRKTGHRTGEQVPRVRTGVRTARQGRTLQGHHDDDAGHGAAAARGGAPVTCRPAGGAQAAAGACTCRARAADDDAGPEQGREGHDARHRWPGARSAGCSGRRADGSGAAAPAGGRCRAVGRQHRTGPGCTTTSRFAK